MEGINYYTSLLSSAEFQTGLLELTVNIILSAIMAFILGRIYNKYAHSLSNREGFSKNFVALAMTTTLIITIIKSSIALSLGLVGALSIVRFRAAIKEPEELTYLFLTISIGLGLGAGQPIITLIAIAVIIIILIINSTISSGKSKKNEIYNLVISTTDDTKVELSKVTELLEKYCNTVKLKRFDEAEKSLEALFFIEIKEFSELEKMKKDLNDLSGKLKITFIDNSEF